MPDTWKGIGQFSDGARNVINITKMLLDVMTDKQKYTIYKAIQEIVKKNVKTTDVMKISQRGGQSPTYLCKEGLEDFMMALAKRGSFANLIQAFMQTPLYRAVLDWLNRLAVQSMEDPNIRLIKKWLGDRGAGRPLAQSTEKWLWLENYMKYEFVFPVQITDLFSLPTGTFAVLIRTNYCPNNPSHTHPMIAVLCPSGIYLLAISDSDCTGDFGPCKFYRTCAYAPRICGQEKHPLVQFFHEGTLRQADRLQSESRYPNNWKAAKHYLNDTDLSEGMKCITKRSLLIDKARTEYYCRTYRVPAKEGKVLDLLKIFQRIAPSPELPSSIQDQKKAVQENFVSVEKERAQLFKKANHLAIYAWEQEKLKHCMWPLLSIPYLVKRIMNHEDRVIHQVRPTLPQTNNSHWLSDDEDERHEDETEDKSDSESEQEEEYDSAKDEWGSDDSTNEEEDNFDD